MQKSIPLIGYLPVPIPHEVPGGYRELTCSIIDDLCNASFALGLDLWGLEALPPTFEIVERDELHRLDLKTHIDERVLDYCEILRFRIYVRVPEDKSDDWEHLCSGIGSRCRKRISDLFIVANMAKPGSIRLEGNGVLLIDIPWIPLVWEIPSTENMYVLDAVHFANKTGWPKLKNLDFVKAWTWASRSNGFVRGFGGDRISRALNAFSHTIFEDTGHGMENPALLFWSLVGIEALYAESNTGIMGQVRDKSAVLLGEQKDSKKKFSQMYNFRSRFIHGDLGFPARYASMDVFGEDSARFTHEFRESTWMAQSILIATLQELIDRDWHGLDFRYTVSNGTEL